MERLPSYLESWSVSRMDIAESNINAPPPVWLKWLKQSALQKNLSDSSSPQPPITLMTQVFKPLRDFSSVCASPPSSRLLLPYPFDVSDLFSVYDCGWLRCIAPVSALLQGRTQQDTDKQKLSPFKRGSTDIGWDECLSVCFCLWVCVQPSPWG